MSKETASVKSRSRDSFRFRSMEIRLSGAYTLMRVVMGPLRVNCQLNFKLFFIKQYKFSPHCQLSVKPKSQIQGLSVVSKIHLSVKNMDDCQ